MIRLVFNYFYKGGNHITEPKKKIAADDILIFYFYLWKKLRLDFSCLAEDLHETSSYFF